MNIKKVIIDRKELKYVNYHKHIHKYFDVNVNLKNNYNEQNVNLFIDLINKMRDENDRKEN